MSSMDGVSRTPKTAPEIRATPGPGDLKGLKKTAEDYVMIENRLAAHRETPRPGPQLNSIFDELRGRLPK